MDADGQFDIHDLERFFPLLGAYDAVLGYRVKRQDTWVRQVNAWGWNWWSAWCWASGCVMSIVPLSSILRTFPLNTS